ncbi:MAG TPA: UDP-N-acetylglucosamine 2-epimerase (non-hydrolyzing) [Polyangiaceae bacterium]
MKRVLVFIGTRPEAIKMAPVFHALDAAPDFEPVVVSTGQHREMLQQVTDLFEIDVAHSLDVMQPNQTLAGLTARLLTAIDDLLQALAPDIALVQGDTTTVLSAALACFYRQIPLGHVEAGLRTHDLRAPFPEEANRVLAGRLVRLHFAPTDFGKNNLLSEGVSPDRIFVTGNTVIDALQMEVARQERPGVRERIESVLEEQLGSDFRSHPFVLITGHRRENFGAGFQQICDALATLADRFPDHRFVYPVHLNPNVQGPVRERLGQHPNIRLIAPQPYSTFVALMNASRLLLTDSGGVQEEAPGLGKPVLVMRDTTERPEGVDAGTVRLVGANAERIVDQVSLLLTDSSVYDAMANAVNPYGDGKAAARIVTALRNWAAEQ